MANREAIERARAALVAALDHMFDIWNTGFCGSPACLIGWMCAANNRHFHDVSEAVYRDKSKPRQRRANLDRMKRRASAVYPHCKRAAQFANHLAICSGPCCGNPRRWSGEKTMQERRHASSDQGSPAL